MVEGLKENDVIKVFEKPIEVRLDIAKTVVIYKGADLIEGRDLAYVLIEGKEDEERAAKFPPQVKA